MPVSLMDRLPLPNLRVYTAASVALLAAAVYHAVGVTSDPTWRANATLQMQKNSVQDGVPVDIAPLPLDLNTTRNLTEKVVDVMTFMMQEPACMWTVINICYCCLAIFAFIIQRAVFGNLRVSEAQRIKDKLWNYVFYKFIFVFGVINVQYMDEVLLWCAWFTINGFLHLLSHLCKDRFEYLSSSPRVARWSYVRVVALVCGVVIAGSAMMAIAVAAGMAAGPQTFFFMAAECYLVLLSALHVLARYMLVLYEADVAGPVAYYTHLFFDASSLVVEAAHVVHMVWVARLLVSAPSLVLLLQLRHLLHQLQSRLWKHRLYTALTTHMSQHYPMASKEEVEKNQDKCAICWEPMKEARKLPCSHLFHNSCLCQWVQQDASCPTCRRALHAAPGAPPPAPAAPPPQPPLAGLAPLTADLPLATTPVNNANRLFHFDGSRYVWWLPSFSVEVTRLRAAPRPPPPPPHQLRAMATQVQTLFPQYNLEELISDLSLSRSVDVTVNNILEGRLAHAETSAAPDTTPMAPTAAEEATTSAGPLAAQPGRMPLLQTDTTVRPVESPALALALGRPPQAGGAGVAALDGGTSPPAAVPALDTSFHQEHSNTDHPSLPLWQKRKEQMIYVARQRYLAKMAARGEAIPEMYLNNSENNIHELRLTPEISVNLNNRHHFDTTNANLSDPSSS